MKHTDLLQVGKQRQRHDHLLMPPSLGVKKEDFFFLA